MSPADHPGQKDSRTMAATQQEVEGLVVEEYVCGLVGGLIEDL